MINPKAQLGNLTHPLLAATREGFGRALLELGKKDERVVVLCADLADSTKVAAFKEAYPSRYIELGVAEQNLATVAAGLAVYGKIPFIASYASFNPGRNNEQIRTTIAINDVPVKIAGMHSGVSVGPDGATHQALEDIALMRVIPNMTVLYPSDAQEAYKATLAAAKHEGPVYLRFGREKTPVMTSPKSPFVIGKAQILWDTEMPEVAIFATGPLVYNALMAAKGLEREMQVSVISVPTIKPLDVKTIVAAAKRAGGVVTVEEHQIAGGMGSAVAEVLAQHYPVPIEFIGVRDSFGQSGTPEELLQHYGLGVSHITAAARKIYHRNGKG
jgi:transketolase